MSVLYVPPCPTTCAGTLGAVDFNDCAPEVHFGEIEWLYLWVLGEHPFATDAEYISPAHWAGHISEAGVAVDAIRAFHVIGEMPEPEQTETPISGDRTIIGFKKFVLNLEIDETNDVNYNFLLLSECGGKYSGAFETADGILYGDPHGISVSIKMNQVIPRERSGVVKIMAKVTWTSKNHPGRMISPIA